MGFHLLAKSAEHRGPEGLSRPGRIVLTDVQFAGDGLKPARLIENV
jgi:hypothetical protein